MWCGVLCCILLDSHFFSFLPFIILLRFSETYLKTVGLAAKDSPKADFALISPVSGAFYMFTTALLCCLLLSCFVFCSLPLNRQIFAFRVFLSFFRSTL
jgi:hypothetical protein